MADKRKSEPDSSEENQYNREQLLKLSSSILKKIEMRMTGGVRFREQKSDNTYLAFCRALTGLIAAHNTVLRDSDLAELETRIEELESNQTGIRKRELNYE